MRRASICSGFLLLAFAVAGCGITVTQKHFLFPWPAPAPLEAETLTRRNVEIPTAEGAVLRGWFLAMPGAKRSVIFFYGNQMSVAKTATATEWLATELGANVLAIDYRGYGFSSGQPSFESITLDGLRIYDHLISKLLPAGAEVIAVGWSLGTIAAIHLAARRPVSRLVLISPPSEVEEVVSLGLKRVPWYQRMWIRVSVDPAFAAMRPRPIDDMPSVKMPLLVVHGTEDEVVPYSCGERIFKLAGTPASAKRFCTIPGARHNEVRLSAPTVQACLRDFLDDPTQARSP